ncbi:MAG: S41 family peptidase [Pseudothermotoga sp.]
MRKLILLFLLLSSSIIAQMFSTEKVLQDAEFIFKKLKDVHPNIFHELSETQAQSEFAKLKLQLQTQEQWEIREIFKVLSGFVAQFKDGHTYLSITDQFSEYLNDKGKVVPIFISFGDEEITILADVEGKITEPSILVSLNGVFARELREEILKTISYERLPFAYARASALFHLFCWVLFGEQETYEIEYLTKEGTVQKITLQSVNFEDYKTRRDQINLSKQKLWDFAVIDETTAILTINTFSSSYEEDLKQFIKQSFEQLKSKGAKNLIIDLRKNGGGSSQLGEYLYSFISDKPYRMYAEVHVRYSDDAIKKLKIFDPILLFRVKVLNQQTIVSKNDFKKPKKNDLLFNGDVFVLVGPQTFSAATDFAAMVKDLAVATIVGEETGGLASCYGDVLTLTLPNTKLNLGISFKYFLRCGGFDDKRGVLPDIIVYADQQATVKGIDQAVQAVLDLLNSEK